MATSGTIGLTIDFGGLFSENEIGLGSQFCGQ
jgi:hypothetical protein